MPSGSGWPSRAERVCAQPGHDVGGVSVGREHRVERMHDAAGTGVDAVGVDETVDPHWANRVLPQGLPVQGNLDPLALIAGGRAVEDAVANIRAAFAGRPHIFNLGHGILPETPLSHVEQLLKRIRG